MKQIRILTNFYTIESHHVNDFGAGTCVVYPEHMFQFSTGEVYPISILEEHSIENTSLYQEIPAMFTALDNYIQGCLSKDENHTAAYLTKLHKELKFDDSPEALVVKVKKKIAGLAQAMTKIPQERPEHGLVWSNKLTLEELLAELKRVEEQ